MPVRITINSNKLNEKIKDEYINFMGIFNKLNNMSFIEDQKIRRSLYKQLQHLIEDRILYRYKIKSPPYHGYNIIEPDEYEIINSFFERRKEYMKKNNELNEEYEKMDNIKKYFINIVNNKKEIFKFMYTDNDNKIEIGDNNEYIKYRKIKIPLDERLIFLLGDVSNELGVSRWLRMILRYIGYGITGQHCSVPSNVYLYMYNEFGINGEGFSSPLNSKLIKMNDAVFCTLFKDTDKYYGSQGPFSHKILVKNSDKNWAVNPPYMENLMNIVYREIMKAFKKISRQDFLIIYFMPKWEDSQSYIKFKKSKYLVKLIEPKEGEHYMNCNGKIIYMRGVVISTFFLCKDKTVVSDEKINKMLKLWNTYIEDKVNQSEFSVPIVE